ncbi:MAG: TIGR03960 family B12-binding radical SAM protein [Phycisphaerae bacterium]|nr:TIGR03960 family B12-binding radical SAM protein [Phycisphaerae bacterium]
MNARAPTPENMRDCRSIRDVADAVSRQVLPAVRRPGQYVGREINARCPDVHAAEVTVALAFPDTYGVGISHLGSQILYQVLNDTPGVAADRTYCPQSDAETLCRQHRVPLWGWESRCAVGDFDVLGFSLSYEMCATNVLTMLDLAGVPLRAERRSQEHPIIVGGEALADTPEPLAPFFDVFLPGDGEQTLAALVERVRQAKRAGTSREDLLLEVARTVPSAYVPRFYAPRYDEAGEFAGLSPTVADLPRRIERAHIARLADSPPVTCPLVPLAEAVHQRVTIEIARGCPHGCRFCQAGHTRRPVRVRSVEEIIATARKALAATGYREISLLSLSAGDYPHLRELIDRLNAEFASQHVSISLPSLRVDEHLAELPRLTSVVRKGGLTIAAEAGSPHLREAIGKDISDADMLAGVTAAYAAGWRHVKVYFMAGLPGEGEGDIDAIYDLCRRLSDARRDVDGQRGAITASVSWLVPKPHTPMQWSPMREAEYFFAVRRRLRELARRSPVSFKFHRIERSILEAVLCRGDRRLADTIEAAWRSGARMDAWEEHFDYARWQAAFQQTGIDPARIAHRPLPLDAALPWSHIAPPVSDKLLRREHQRMMDMLAWN